MESRCFSAINNDTILKYNNVQRVHECALASHANVKNGNVDEIRNLSRFLCFSMTSESTCFFFFLIGINLFLHDTEN